MIQVGTLLVDKENQHAKYELKSYRQNESGAWEAVLEKKTFAQGETTYRVVYSHDLESKFFIQLELRPEEIEKRRPTNTRKKKADSYLVGGW